MDKVRKSLIFITVLTFFYGLYYWGIPALINIENRMPVIEKQIQAKTGYKLSVKSPYVKMGHTPAIWFMAEDISLLNNDGTQAFNMQHSAIKIYLLPLLAGKIQIGNFSSDSITANLFYTKNSELKLGQYKLEKLPQSKMELTKAYIRLGNYKISLNDLKQNKKILLDGTYLTVDEFKNNKKIKLSTSANLSVDKKISEIMADVDIKLPINKITEDQFKVKGRITNLNLADFSEYATVIPNSKIETLSGIINLIADTNSKPDKHKNIFAKLSIENLGIIQKEKARSIYCNNKINIRTDIDTIKNGINIKNMKILSDGIDINTRGRITRLDAKIPYLDMDVAINKSRTENFIPLMPGEENLLEEINFYALKKNPFYGDITGNLNIKGKADTADVTGKILVTEGYLNKPLPNNTEKAVIKLSFNGQKMVMDAKVPASLTETVFIKGDVELYNNKNADLYIKSTKNVDLKIAQTVLNPLHEILKFDLGPVPIMDIKGKGGINLSVFSEPLTGIQAILDQQPDLVFLDIEMNGMSEMIHVSHQQRTHCFQSGLAADFRGMQHHIHREIRHEQRRFQFQHRSQQRGCPFPRGPLGGTHILAQFVTEAAPVRRRLYIISPVRKTAGGMQRYRIMAATCIRSAVIAAGDGLGKMPDDPVRGIQIIAEFFRIKKQFPAPCLLPCPIGIQHGGKFFQAHFLELKYMAFNHGQ